MDEYIDRKLLKKRFLKRLDWLKKDIHDEYSGALYDCCETDIDLIDEIPSVDVAPVVHGEWIFGEIGPVGCAVKCSACGWGLNSVDPALWVDYAEHNYCGSCGAKMDGGVNE